MRSTGGTRWSLLGMALLVGLLALGSCASDSDAPEAVSEEATADATRTAETTTTTAEATTTTTEATTTTTTEQPPLADRSLPVVEESPGVEPGFTVHRPTDMEATGGPLPVVVWANGGCVRFDRPWKVLFERWAEAGFFVISLAQPPDAQEADDEMDREEMLANPTSVDDHAALIDWAVQQNELDGGPYEGLLDTDRIVAAGNSCGGITALGLASQDARVASVFVLSGSSTPPGLGPDQAGPIMDGVRVPVGFVVGGSTEDIAYPQAIQDYELLGEGIPGMVVNRSSGDHQTVSTDESILPDVAAIALDWMDFTLFGTGAAAAALSSETVCPGCEPGLWTVTAKNL